MNEKVIWDTIKEEIKNSYGVAGIMGNLMAESSLNPVCVTKRGLDVSGSEYVRQIKEGIITPEGFAHDGVAFGLVQWLYWSRKGSLLEYVGKDKIDNVVSQIRFMLHEMKSYKTVWNTVNSVRSVREASDVVMERYEKPGNVSEKAKEKRAGYGEKYYGMFAEPESVLVETTADRVNMRSGNGKNYMVVRRIEKKGTTFKYVAKSENNWYAVDTGDDVLWISGVYSRIKGGSD